MGLLVKAENISIEKQILKAIAEGSAIAIGSGCGRSEAFKNIMKIVLKHAKAPIVKVLKNKEHRVVLSKPINTFIGSYFLYPVIIFHSINAG